MALPMLLTGDRKSSWIVTMLLALDEDDTMTPTERELMAEVGDEGESEWAGGSFNKKIKKNQQTCPRQ